MKLLFFESDCSEVVKDFLLDTLKRSSDYPMKLIFSFKFSFRLLDSGRMLYMIRLDTTLLNFLPAAFFKLIFSKGLRKAGYAAKVDWLKSKEVLILLGGLD